jgi:hypothetical protein
MAIRGPGRSRGRKSPVRRFRLTEAISSLHSQHRIKIDRGNPFDSELPIQAQHSNLQSGSGSADCGRASWSGCNWAEKRSSTEVPRSPPIGKQPSDSVAGKASLRSRSIVSERHFHLTAQLRRNRGLCDGPNGTRAPLPPARLARSIAGGPFRTGTKSGTW